MKKTYCTRISQNPKITLCDGTLLFADGLAIKTTKILNNIVLKYKNLKNSLKIFILYRETFELKQFVTAIY
jgi:hypothetical protein